jgi:hypothetical protein
MTVLMLVLWSLFLAAGIMLYRGVVGQHVPGYPNAGQFKLLLRDPSIMIGLNLIMLLLHKRINFVVVAVTSFGQLSFLLLLFMLAGGGV